MDSKKDKNGLLLNRTISPRLTKDDPELAGTNGRPFPTNKLKSTKYNSLNIVPYTFLMQFTKLANVYVLGNVIL